MPQLRVSGFLDEGTDVDPRDAERLLPPSTVHVKGSASNTQRGGRLMDTQSSRSQFHKGHHRIQPKRRPDRYPAAGLNRSMPNEWQHACVPSVSRELQHYPPTILGQNSGTRQNMYESLTNVNSAYYSASNSIPSRAYHDSQQLVQKTIKGSQIESTQQQIATQTSSPMEQESDEEEDEDEDEDYVCCDLQSTSRQPLCDEGTKNLCTLAIWAVIIFAICNRFLMHMSLFLHESGSVKGVVEVTSPDGVSILEKSSAAPVTESGMIDQTMHGGR
ncbi:hypothetical protein ACHAW6_009124 [Cyclotella cf. meneghiniana]